LLYAPDGSVDVARLKRSLAGAASYSTASRLQVLLGTLLPLAGAASYSTAS
jgi:hypothetical protein